MPDKKKNNYGNRLISLHHRLRLYIVNACVGKYENSLFTDKGCKLLLTQVASPRYSVQDNKFLSLLFEPYEYFRMVGQMD